MVINVAKIDARSLKENLIALGNVQSHPNLYLLNHKFNKPSVMFLTGTLVSSGNFRVSSIHFPFESKEDKIISNVTKALKNA